MVLFHRMQLPIMSYYETLSFQLIHFAGRFSIFGIGYAFTLVCREGYHYIRALKDFTQGIFIDVSGTALTDQYVAYPGQEWTWWRENLTILDGRSGSMFLNVFHFPWVTYFVFWFIKLTWRTLVSIYSCLWVNIPPKLFAKLFTCSGWQTRPNSLLKHKLF